MAAFDVAALDQALQSLPSRYSGPGGVAGVVKDGKIIRKMEWGYADLAARRPMTSATLLPICSITKQFTCAVLLNLVDDTALLDDRIGQYLPNLTGRLPSVAELSNNQSGLRDYWALTVLHGAAAEGRFNPKDAETLLARMHLTQFEPGSHYSYSNGNFRILSDLIEDYSGRSLGELYREMIFDPAGMKLAEFTPDTTTPADGVVGCEGNNAIGFFPATNHIYWSGDAGISAGLDDMLAWECYIDSTRDDANGIYSKLTRPQPFSDGTPSRYGFGLATEMAGDVQLSGHGGALRGFRCRRQHAASERLSVVVMFNHEADAHAAANMVLKAALGQTETKPSPVAIEPEWVGDYFDPQTGLVLSLAVKNTATGSLEARYATSAETLDLETSDTARNASMTLVRDGNTIRLERPGENLRSSLSRISKPERNDLEGRFFSAELQAWLEITSTGGVLYGGFEGFLGVSPMYSIHQVGPDIWQLACLRSMDAPAPGNWTIHVSRDASNAISGLTISCWLARNIRYERVV